MLGEHHELVPSTGSAIGCRNGTGRCGAALTPLQSVDDSELRKAGRLDQPSLGATGGRVDLISQAHTLQGNPMNDVVNPKRITIPLRSSPKSSDLRPPVYRNRTGGDDLATFLFMDTIQIFF